MNYWMFKANPDLYRIDERLLAPEPTVVWSVTRYLERIQPGDTVFVWRAGTQPGICAVMLVEACPYAPEERELNDGFEIPVGGLSPAAGQWAKCRFIKRFRTIEKSVIKKIPGLDLFSFFSAFQQAINYTLTRPEGTILLEFIEENPTEEPPKKVAKVLKPVIRTRNPEAVHASARVSSPAKDRPAASAPKKVRPPVSATTTSEVALLKCASCGRYVVSTDTERHVREAHAGQSVDWQKTR